MRAYAVRHKPSGLFIPRLETGKRRGGSHLEPSADREPRIFHNKLAARCFLGNWLQGTFSRHGYTSHDGDYDEVTKVTPQKHRRKADMEIVEFKLVEVRNGRSR